MITIMKDIDPPKAAPKRIEAEYALQIGAVTIFPSFAKSGLLVNLRFGLNFGPAFGDVY
jgi:hypothetical protein